jgi:hypothetical protein
MSIPSIDQLMPWFVFAILTVWALAVAVDELLRARRRRQRWRYEDEALKRLLDADRALKRLPGEADDEAPGH